MVLSHLADKLGIWDVLAPVSNKIKSQKKRRAEEERQIINDEKVAHELQKKENDRFQRLKAQFENEEKARKVNQFAKRQRVSYHSKADDELFEAIVVAVHLDDGPDNPYYTIQYKKTITTNEENATTTGIKSNDSNNTISSNRTVVTNVEKQTNADRLSRLEWDEEKTWKIIDAKK